MRYTNVTSKAVCLITLTCPEGHQYLADEQELESTFSECELCGDHGDVEISWTCKACNKGYIYTLKSW